MKKLLRCAELSALDSGRVIYYFTQPQQSPAALMMTLFRVTYVVPSQLGSVLIDTNIILI